MIFLVMTITILFCCFQVLLNLKAEANDKRLAAAIASITSGGVVFITGSKAVG